MAIALILVPVRLEAQAYGDTIPESERCPEAVRIAQTSPQSVEAEWAFEYLPHCGTDGGLVLADLVRLYRASSDTLLLDRITWPANELVDGQLFDASLEVASDGGASLQARVFALRTLLFTLTPGANVKYGDLARTDSNFARCMGDSWSASGELFLGDPLPASYGVDISALVDGIIADNTETPELRFGATCVRLADPDSATPPQPSGPSAFVPSGTISLTYQCGNTFVVSNPFEVDLDLTYEVIGTGETGTVSVPAAPYGSPLVQVELTTASAGTVRLYLDGDLVTEAYNTDLPCGT